VNGFNFRGGNAKGGGLGLEEMRGGRGVGGGGIERSKGGEGGIGRDERRTRGGGGGREWIEGKDGMKGEEAVRKRFGGRFMLPSNE